MNFSKLVLFAYLGSLPIVSYANQCGDVFMGSLRDGYIFETDHLNETSQEYLQLAYAINEWLPQTLRVERVKISGDEAGQSTTDFSQRGRSLGVNYFLSVIYMGNGTPNQTHDGKAAIFAHEFGHSIFDFHHRFSGEKGKITKAEISKKLNEVLAGSEYQILTTEISTLKQQLSEVRLKAKPEIIILQNELLRLNTSKESTAFQNNLKDGSRVGKIRERLFELESVSRLLVEQINKLERKRWNSFDVDLISNKIEDSPSSPGDGGHNEFFADLTSILFLNKISAIKDSLDESGHPSRSQDDPNNGRIPGRDFTAVTSFKHWEMHPNSRADRYSRFDPVRAPLIRLIEKHQIGPDKYPKVLEAVFAAIQNHYDSPDFASTGADYAKLNRDFFRHIVVSMQRYGLIPRSSRSQ